MKESYYVKNMQENIQKAMELPKCRKCGCMKESLETIKRELLRAEDNNLLELINQVEDSLNKMDTIKYTWLGCKHCWSADITNAFDEAFAELNSIHSVEKESSDDDELNNLPAAGEYNVLSLEKNCPIAISTLSNTELADKISELKPRGLSIVGKTETENIGIEKLIKNVLAVPSIKYLILCGKDSEGHFSGDALASLVKNGVDSNMKVIGSKGRKPILPNMTIEEIKAFRNQIEIIDMIGSEEIKDILLKKDELFEKTITGNCCESNTATGEGKIKTSAIEIIKVGEKDPDQVKLDKAGYFVIMPMADSGTILVEHYNYNNYLLRIIKGKDARNIYWTIIEKGWVSEMSHAAYLGKELTKAELSIKLGFKYVQDKA